MAWSDSIWKVIPIPHRRTSQNYKSTLLSSPLQLHTRSVWSHTHAENCFSCAVLPLTSTDMVGKPCLVNGCAGKSVKMTACGTSSTAFTTYCFALALMLRPPLSVTVNTPHPLGGKPRKIHRSYQLLSWSRHQLLQSNLAWTVCNLMICAAL